MVPNPEQDAATKALRGKVLISAGAGSGKTRTLVTRFADALEAHPHEEWHPAPVDGVVAITFTDKAAGEIAERVRSTLRERGSLTEARGVDGAWIGTIHSFCTRVLRRYALEAGIDPLFSVVDGVEGERIRQQAFETACALAGHDARSALLGEYEFDDVYSAVVNLADHARTSGIELAKVEVESAPRSQDLLRDAVEALAEGRDAVRSCGDERAQATKLLVRCGEACESLAGIDADDLSDSDLALEVWKALARFKPSGSAASIRDIAAELAEHRRQLAARAVSAAVSSYATALVGLAVEFDAEYRRLKHERSLLDFDDLQIETGRLFAARPDILAEVRDRFRMVMVDEFQDTDELQLSLVSAVAGENLCTVGDEQQSIYGFRGAAVEVYRRHNEAMRAAGAREFVLSLNYRSHPAVLDFVNHIFGGLFGASLIRLEAGRVEVPTPLPDGFPRVDLTLVRASTSGTGRAVETEQVADRLAELRDSYGMDPGDMVVLLRSYTHAQSYAAALSRRGFAVSVVGGSRFFSVPAVVVGRALLSAIVNPQDDAALAVLLGTRELGPSDDGLWALGMAARRLSGSLWESFEAVSGTVSTHDQARFVALKRAIERARRQVGSCRLSEVTLTAIEDLGYDLALLAAGEEGRTGFSNLLKLASMADAFERSGGAGPAAFVSYLDAKEQYRDHTAPATLADERGRSVRIMSIHASKGLEFPVVVLPELGAQGRGEGPIAGWCRQGERITVAMRLPSDLGTGASSDAKYSELFGRIQESRKRAEIEESQRLFYVGCTRAREVLVLSGSGTFTGAPKEGSSLPIEWLRAGLGIESHDDGVAELQMVGECSYLLRTVDAASWEREPAADAPPADGALADTVGDDSFAAPEPEATRTGPNHAPPKRMSYSDFSLHESCAKRFWATRIMRVGSVSSSGAGDPVRFGSAVHAALELLADNTMPDDDRLRTLSRAFGLEEREAQELRDTVTSYLNSQVAGEFAALGLVRREWPFALPIATAHGEFVLAGSVDAYGRRDGDALVVDYKTGRSGDAGELRSRYALQAATYGLAVLQDGCTKVRVVFIRPQANDEAGRPQQVDFVFDSSDAPRIREELAERYERIATQGFSALERWDPHTCGECPIAGSICTVTPGPGWRLAPENL